MSLQNWLRGACAGVAALIGSLPPVVHTLMYFMAADIVTGVLLAIVARQELSLDKSYRGIMRKAGMLLLVSLGVLIDRQSAGSVPILQGLAGFFIAHEGLSVCRNLNALGVPVPPILLRALEQWQAKKDAAATREEAG